MYMRSEPVMLAIDIGSSSVKGLAYDQRGQALAGIQARVPCPLVYLGEGGAEVRLNRVVQAVDQVLDILHLRVGAREVLGVAFTSIASSLVALDEGLRPLEPVLSYADTRSHQASRALPLDLSRVHRTGCPDYSAYWTAQIPYWKTVFSHEARLWCSVADFLLHRYFGGEVRTSYSLASWTGLLNRHTLQWDSTLLQQLYLSVSELPLLTDATLPHQHLLPEHAKRWPKFAHIPFFPAIGDGAAANLGSGATRAGQVALTVGTTSALRCVLPARDTAVPDGLWTYLIDQNHALMGGALTEGGNIHQWMRETLNLGPWNELEGQLAHMAPDSHGLTFVPSFSGERSPNYDPLATGTVHGLKLSTRPIQLLRAGMEGIAYRMADIASRLHLALSGPPTYIASGQAVLSSNVWLQMFADVLGGPVLVTDLPDESTARGAALMALSALNILDPYDLPPRVVVGAFEPDPQAHELYQDAMERQIHLMRLLKQAAQQTPFLV